MSDFTIRTDALNNVSAQLGNAMGLLTQCASRLDTQAGRLNMQMGFGMVKTRGLITSTAQATRQLSQHVQQINGFIATLRNAVTTHENAALRELSGARVVGMPARAIGTINTASPKVGRNVIQTIWTQSALLGLSSQRSWVNSRISALLDRLRGGKRGGVGGAKGPAGALSPGGPSPGDNIMVLDLPSLSDSKQADLWDIFAGSGGLADIARHRAELEERLVRLNQLEGRLRLQENAGILRPSEIERERDEIILERIRTQARLAEIQRFVSMSQPADRSLDRITDRFGWRTHPISGIWSHHNGIDIGHGGNVRNGVGPPISTMVSGEVVDAGFEDGGHGNFILIRGICGRYFMYSHLHSKHVSVGDKIKAGTPIGDMGTTGNSTGVHLHLEVRTEKRRGHIDPYHLLYQDQVILPSPSPSIQQPQSPQHPPWFQPHWP